MNRRDGARGGGDAGREELPGAGFTVPSRAVFDPDNSWKWLSEAERWEHLADAEIDAHYQECNSAGTTARDRNLPVERWRLAS
jgi:hypothetical protein